MKKASELNDRDLDKVIAAAIGRKLERHEIIELIGRMKILLRRAYQEGIEQGSNISIP